MKMLFYSFAIHIFFVGKFSLFSYNSITSEYYGPNDFFVHFFFTIFQIFCLLSFHFHIFPFITYYVQFYSHFFPLFHTIFPANSNLAFIPLSPHPPLHSLIISFDSIGIFDQCSNGQWKREQIPDSISMIQITVEYLYILLLHTQYILVIHVVWTNQHVKSISTINIINYTREIYKSYW